MSLMNTLIQEVWGYCLLDSNWDLSKSVHHPLLLHHHTKTNSTSTHHNCGVRFSTLFRLTLCSTLSHSYTTFSASSNNWRGRTGTHTCTTPYYIPFPQLTFHATLSASMWGSQIFWSLLVLWWTNFLRLVIPWKHMAIFLQTSKS